MNHSYKTCKNHESLYFGSGIKNNETLTKYTYELIAFVEEPYWGLAGSSNKQQDRRVLVQ